MPSAAGQRLTDRPEHLLTSIRRKSKIVALRINMALTQEKAVEEARKDLAKRLSVSENDVREGSVAKVEFPDMSLGAPANGEMSAQMISTGWKINLNAKGKNYEYRADKYQLRLKDFDGANYVIIS